MYFVKAIKFLYMYKTKCLVAVKTKASVNSFTESTQFFFYCKKRKQFIFFFVRMF